MARYTIEGTVVETKNAQCKWEEDTRWNGNNHISVATGSQWEHETLYLSMKDNYYIVHSSQWQGSEDVAEFVSDEAAALWLLRNGHDLPEALEQYQEAICE